jgi:hypothetical protein
MPKELAGTMLKGQPGALQVMQLAVSSMHLRMLPAWRKPA